jgi:hypothetical protein
MTTRDHALPNLSIQTLKITDKISQIIPPNTGYRAVCHWVDANLGQNITYNVEIDLTDEIAGTVEQFAFSQNHLGPIFTPEFLPAPVSKTLIVQALNWPDADKYAGFVNVTRQINPPDNSYVSVSFSQIVANPKIERHAVLTIHLF